jgi:hypothetical protein
MVLEVRDQLVANYGCFSLSLTEIVGRRFVRIMLSPLVYRCGSVSVAVGANNYAFRHLVHYRPEAITRLEHMGYSMGFVLLVIEIQTANVLFATVETRVLQEVLCGKESIASAMHCDVDGISLFVLFVMSF